MTVLLLTCKQYPQETSAYEVSQEGEVTVIKPFNYNGTGHWTPKGLENRIKIDQETKKDHVIFSLNKKKVVLDYSEIEELFMAIKVHNKQIQAEYNLSELREY
tara:strand:+ start:398 stop:706 length:309 start_codon:yes stop_codon:yes gene_type:complete